MSSSIYINDEDNARITETGNMISSKSLRNNMNNAVLLVTVAEKYLSDKNVSIDTTSLCYTENFLSAYGMADIYINGFCVGIINADEKTGFSVPCLHFKKNIVPAAYMFIQREPLNDSYSVTGFVLKDDINPDSLQNGYYIVDKDEIKPFAEIEYIFSGHVEEDLPYDFEKQVFDYFDSNSDEIDSLIGVLLNSRIARAFFIRAYKARKLFNFVSTPEIKETVADENNILQNNSNTELMYKEDASAYDDAAELINLEAKADSFDIGEISNEYQNQQENQAIMDDMTNSEPEEYTASTSQQEYTENEQIDEYVTDTVPSLEELERDLSATSASNVSQSTSETDNYSINDLYNKQDQNVVYGSNFLPQKRKSNFVPALLIISLLAVGGYFGYTKFYANSGSNYQDNVNNELTEPLPQANDIDQPDAMPVESLENTSIPEKTEQPESISIPAIENSIDASVLVENLSVNWQVPSGYTSNSSAKKYFTRIGKIIQLNLKTEMLLLNKLPLSDKIVLELEFDKHSQNFVVKDITTSSGEQAVDDLAKAVVTKVFRTTKYTNTGIFNKIQGNPILIIHL